MNAYQKLISLMPKPVEFVGTIQIANHPQYDVLNANGTGLIRCTSSAIYATGSKVYVKGLEIQNLAPIGNTYEIHV